MSVHVTDNAKETEMLGFQLASLLRYEDHPIILLDGPLAAGKTTFTKGIARALGIQKLVNSPTYTIMKMYQSEDLLKTLHHLDLYRLETLGNDFDLEEYIHNDGFSVIEWPFQIEELIPLEHVLVTFEHISEEKRMITITCHGHYCSMLENKL